MIGAWKWTLIHDPRDELDATARHVGLTLAVHADDDGTGARPTVDTLAAACRRKRTTIRRALDVLDQLGYLDRRQPSRRQSTRYRLTLPSGSPTAPTQTVPDGTPSRAETVPYGTHSDGPPGDPLDSEAVPPGPHSVGPLRAPSGSPRGPRPPTTSNSDDVTHAHAREDHPPAAAVADRVTRDTGLPIDAGIRQLIADRLDDGWDPDRLASHLASKASFAQGPGLLVTVLRDLPVPEPPRPRVDVDACPDCSGTGLVWPDDGRDPWQCTHDRLSGAA